MNSQNAYKEYTKNKILTATPAELVLFLYDGFIKFCNMAKIGVDEHDYGKANTNIKKAERIIAELQNTLDYKYEVSNDFNNIYSYVMRRLHEANMKKDCEILDECNTHIRDLRETWKEVMKQTASR